MQVFYFHPATGEYLGYAESRQDPKASGSYLIPANATAQAPPEAGDNQTARWGGSAWELVADYRAVDWWNADGSRGGALALGEDLPAGAVLTAPPEGYAASWDGSVWVIDLEAAQKAAYARLSQDYSQYIDARGYPPSWQNSCGEFRRRFEGVLADESATAGQKEAAQTGLARIEEIQTWLMETLFRYYGDISADIFAAGGLEALQGITWDFNQFTASDPNVSLGKEILPLDVTARPAA